MFEHLKRTAARLRSSAPDAPPMSPPGDPDAGVRQPVNRRGPPGSSAAAVAEPDDEREPVVAIGGHR